MISLFIPAIASAENEPFFSTDPVPEVPVGAHLEGDILVWDADQGEGGGAPDGGFWSNGIVPYIFSNNVSNARMTRAINAMQLWENVANVNFRPWQVGDISWLFIQNASNNSSFVGPQGGAQNVNIVSWANQSIIAHELAHALGVRHEQSRTDRNTFVTINFNNISSTCGSSGTVDCTSNFNIIQSTSGWLYSPYDYDSVMHYSPTSFTTGGNTINTKAPFNSINISFVGRDIGPDGQCFTDPVPTGGWQNGIGQRNHLSHWDCRMMSFIYPQANWRFLQPSRANVFIKLGLFSFPWALLSDGIAGTPSNGTLWIDNAATYPAISINKAITLRAPKGRVFIN